ncbi:PilZ domain-containing protein [Methylomarinum sp. Ch1-1]|uniref:PilZ domain-containing protein n=1 Tax=Methylomarinum roseum TaxID=3067653 RepID=A0AAU7NY33_9GAMM|nr:PilZ domain-containing protein [Methylomarinum sp. Ch1-1]MDP4522044.1 PilZ domain-containing protein [Methylomarinum sp. Ch1-1]
MTEERPYRKNLATKGLVYLGGQELEIEVKNLSITGLLARLQASEPLHEVKEFFQAIRVSPLVDIYLPELRLIGEAEVVRSEKIDGSMHFALEFRNISYDIDNLLYSRRAYRKNINDLGCIVLNQEAHAFYTENVSVDGMMIRLDERVDVKPEEVVSYQFKRLELSGESKVVWVEHDEQGTWIGLEYLHLEKDSIKGVPRFYN